jgi:hypothetical protein
MAATFCVLVATGVAVTGPASCWALQTRVADYSRPA